MRGILGLVEHPIIQAPMAGTSTPELAAAVSNAGALGSIGIATSSPEDARRMIEATRARTSLPFNVNVFCHQPARRDAAIEQAWIDYLAPTFREFGAEPPAALKVTYKSFIEDDAMFRVLLELKPPVVSFHFGLQVQSQIDALKAAGVCTFATATNLDDARTVVAAGIDAIVAQGIEAGGHRGVFDRDAPDPGLSTSALVQLLVTSLNVPVIAAGGIMDGKGIRSVLDLGAAAAQMGTAFVLSPESAADANHRGAFKTDRVFRTRFTTTVSGRPARGMPNRLMALGDKGPAIPAYPVTYDASSALNRAARVKGSFEFSSWWAGQGAPLARSLPAAELIAELLRELDAAGHT